MAIASLLIGAQMAMAHPAAAAPFDTRDAGPVVIYRPPPGERAYAAYPAARQPCAPVDSKGAAATAAASSPPAPATSAPAVAAQPLATSPPASAQPFHNPFGRDVDVTMSLTYGNIELGDIPVTLTRDNQIFVHTAEFAELVEPLLSPLGVKGFDSAVAGRPKFEPQALAAAGITLEFDPAALSVVILKIDPRDQLPRTLYQSMRRQDELAQPPSKFSAYVNLSGAAAWTQGQGTTPFLDIQGVVHYDHLVLESDFAAQNQFDVASSTNRFQLQRRYVRLVYDDPGRFLRFYLGDLTPEFRGQQGNANLGGIGLVRERQIYDPDRVGALTGNQQLVLQNDATVNVLRNGSLIQQLHLTSGSYNLSNLPLVAGSNNIQLQIHEITGATRTIGYSTFLDPIDIQPGDYEYAAYFGALSQTVFGTPVYSGGVAFTGFYRRALLNSDAFGVGLQAGKDVQMTDGELRLPLKGGARLDFDAGVSHATVGGVGGTFSAGYEQLFDRGGLTDSFSAQVAVNSKYFAVLGASTPIDPTALTLSLSYSHSFSDKWQTTAEVEYTVLRDPTGSSVSAEVDNFYQVTRQWSVRVGVSYQDAPTESQRGFGVLFGLIWRPDQDHRAEARYDGSRDIESVSFTKSSQNYVGSYGYSGIVQQSAGQASLSGEADYYANRAQLQLQAGTTGSSFGSIGTTPTATVSVGTSIGFVDGRFAIGHPISDSFVVAYPHPSLDNRSVIVGDDLQDGRFNAASSILGPALYAFLPSYNADSVHYDVVNPPLGYDIGEGSVNIRPLYRSGYALQVGSDSYISVTGTLVNQEGKPVALAGGEITALNDPKAKSQPFFTNSVGRFAAEGLKPGGRYRVNVNASSLVSFTFETPKKGAALIDLKRVTVNVPVD